MRLLLPARLVVAALAFAALPLAAQETGGDAGSVIDRWRADPATVFDAAEIVLDDLEYVARPLVVFGDSPNQPQVQQQLRLLSGHAGELALRDVIVIVDTDPDARSDPRRSLRPRGFSLVLIDKDGTVVFRKPEPWDVREIGRQIDKLPSRQQEIRDRPATAGAQ